MRVGFDIGGTFTDVIVIDDQGRLTAAKVLSLLDRVGENIVALVGPLAASSQIENFVHGTTIASNAVIEGNTASTALITTRGFRDNLEMRGQRRPNLQDPNWIRTPALVPRRLRFELTERILGDGTVEQVLSIEELRTLLRSLAHERVQAIAVCLINSYLNAAHEQQVRDVIESELGPDAVVCLSSEIYPQIREYDRASTTVINASLIPVVDRYLSRVEKHLTKYSSRLLIMQSNGGIMSAQAARRKPAYMIESGPAAGALAAARLAREAQLDQVLSFDMGGTTAKACLIEDGIPAEKAAGEIGGAVNTTTHLFYKGGHALIVPSLDIVEVGAGGGSIAWVEQGGTLRVGPQSAGADPGPVCYGRGGREPTVTDANVVLGYMNPQIIAGSALQIDHRAAADAIRRRIAEPLKLDLLEAAHGIVQIANSLMMRALRAVSTERGRDPRDYTLLAFGGSGPIHAAALAETMEISRVTVPIYPGLFSALGLLLADYRHDYIRSISGAHAKRANQSAARWSEAEPSKGVRDMRNTMKCASNIVSPLQTVRLAEIEAYYHELEQAALAEMQSEGISAEAVVFERYIDLKYGYQLQELTLRFPADDECADLPARLTEMFIQAHDQAFGYHADDPIELVSLRLRVLAPAGTARFSELAKGSTKSALALSEDHSRQVFFGHERGLLHTPIRTRADIVGPQPGPLIIEEPDTTIVVPPGWSVSSDQHSNLTLSRI
jgi:N-methylhydantoinase A